MHLLTIFLATIALTVADRSFVIDYANDQFLKDGKPFRYMSGSLHYFQVPSAYWEDRLMRAQAMGLNAIQTYIMWNLHEPVEGQFDFESERANIEQFFQIANKLGLLVILRPGPYICAEKEMGGFPAWLLKNPDIKLRTIDPNYINPVTNWFNVLLPKIKPYLYKNGGPIIMVQIENEYGSYYACDKNYTAFLRDFMQSHLGKDDVVYFTTDGNDVGYLKCGYIPGVYPTVDFGINDLNGTIKSFKAQRAYAPHGPLVNSEFYPGWFDQWGDKQHNTVDTDDTLATINYMYNLGANFNIYMATGGTNWAYSSGAEGNGGTEYTSIVTSYDYDAPISESGDLTPKWYALKQTFERLTQSTVPYPPPIDNEKVWYGPISFNFVGDFFQLLSVLTPNQNIVQAKFPVTAENLDQTYGFILYETKLPQGGNSLNLSSVHDRGYAFVDQELVGIVQRPFSGTLSVSSLTAGSKVQILVENQGRINYGSAINDRKGIVGNVTLDGNVLTDWTMYPLNLDNVHNFFSGHPELIQFFASKAQRKLRKSGKDSKFIPSFFVSTVNLTPRVGDTFFDPTGWGKGQLLVNGMNLGRYWPAKGPQITLYVPKPYLASKTQIMLFELDKAGNCAKDNSHCDAKLVNQANLG